MIKVCESGETTENERGQREAEFAALNLEDSLPRFDLWRGRGTSLAAFCISVQKLL